MEIFEMTMTRPSTPLTLACAPFALQLVAPVAAPAAERAPVSRVHQVSVQAELAELGRGGANSTTGFKGSNVSISKRYTDGGSGVPPRGRPV
ncbi:hypothetical protein AB0J83_34665 [Actinoplanes sp. NPDC049596]|uniref:hypothetical protein n=1 Tax=unclassified Actinoplanes TaxID=2626549 RepID=UPI00341C47E0